ncbi:MAG: hypothetical protein ACRDHU_13500 [Actinomycetota bacterium]
MLRRGPPYASAAFLGSALYVGLVGGADVRKVWAQLVVVAMICLIRGVSVWRGWESPEPRDLTPAALRARERDTSGAQGTATGDGGTS